MAKRTLTRDENEKLIEGERLLGEASALLDQLEACEEDCQAMRQFITDQQRRIGLIRQHMGGGPKRGT